MELKYDEKSCGIILFREENNQRMFLLLHYPSGHWDFAKGHVENGETEQQTAQRELLEETGISDIEFIDGYRECMDYRFRNRGKMSHKVVVYFLAKTNSKEVQMSHEHRDFTWLPYEESLRRLTFDNARNLLKKAKEVLAD